MKITTDETELKRRRSKDRCHLICRMPLFDRSGRASLYHFYYTAGTVFEPEALQQRHVRHVLMGYFLRRNMDLFSGTQATAMLTMPLSNDMLRYLSLLPVGRMVVHLPERQELSVTNVHLVSALNRGHLRLAINVYTVVFTDWAQSLRCFDYLVVDCTQNVEEQLHLAKNVLKRSRAKLVFLRPDSPQECAAAFKIGASYAGGGVMPRELQSGCLDEEFSHRQPQLSEDVCRLLCVQLGEHADRYEELRQVLEKYPFCQAFACRLLDYIVFNPHNRTFLTDWLKEMPYVYRHGWDEALYSVDPQTGEYFVGVLSAYLLGLRFEPEPQRSARRISYEPFRIAAVRGRFLNLTLREQVPKDQQRPAMPTFIVGLLSALALFETEEIGDAYELLRIESERLLAAEPQLAAAITVIEALERLDLPTVRRQCELIPGFTVERLLDAYEESVMWTEGLIRLLSCRTV